MEEEKKSIRDNIDVVLVKPQGPGNIGSVSRVLMNTGFRNLVLVDPVDFHCNEAYAMACNASEVLLGARVTKDLDEALGVSKFIVATSRRRGKLRYPTMTLDVAVPEILKHARKNRVSLLFGREDKGLLNDEVARADIVIEIPTHDDYPSLNLSHAVFSVCHALYSYDLPLDHAFDLAERREVVLFYEHLEKTLRALGYGEADKGGEHLLKVILRNFRRLYGRSGLMEKEVSMIRGILAKVEENIKE